MAGTDGTSRSRWACGLHRNVILLGLVSFLTDVSSEMILPLLPLFITTLGGGGLAVGVVSGMGDAVADLLKVFAGHRSDRSGRRKPLVFAGYGVSAVAKMFYPLSVTWWHLVLVRPLERVGKGLRTAPRDALIADCADEAIRGKAFGFHRTMDTAGAVLGSVLALVLFWLWKLDIRQILALAAVVAFASLIPLAAVREDAGRPAGQSRLVMDLRRLSPAARRFLLCGTLFALGHFSYMFFLLKAAVFGGQSRVIMPLILYIWFNVVYTAGAFPAGRWSDVVGRKTVVALGYLVFAIASLGVGLSSSVASLVFFFAVYGVAQALTEATQRAFMADLSLAETRAAALGAYHTATGLTALPAGLAAGFLWQYAAPALTFVYGALLALMAAVLLWRWVPSPSGPAD